MYLPSGAAKKPDIGLLGKVSDLKNVPDITNLQRF